ncbi:winged helix-turn-helix transcriptional regulator [Erysipelothrix sp. HDW6C]|uniref:MarR family winged helix-turn-helix transcriptional regulator n=1 Tax=Erysipelothrix sp. HDW6C TaxID=2714930 RepID=UPI00140C3318|nr:MarR family winged helix-turn-helix transcriptional regulator [Erysipelothrix sp. HDW6C]QIK68814.1 winged helix-turn-helix transcriptional regulator [Erysipelothrix sp. HDW6C]
MGEYELWNEIFVSSQHVKGRFNTAMESLAKSEGLTVQQMLVMFGIHVGMLKTIGDVAKELKIFQANASTVCKKLENANLALRSKSDTDERVVILSLTPLGTDKITNIIHFLTGKLERMTQAFPNTFDLVAIRTGISELNKLVDAFIEFD